MKKKWILISCAAMVVGLLHTGCGPIVTGGPDVVVGGGIYPAPIPVPGPGPYVFRPGAPRGPGFQPGYLPPQGRSGGPGNPGIGPGGPGGMPGGPGGGPGGPGGPGGGPGGMPGGPGGPGGGPGGPGGMPGGPGGPGGPNL